MKNKEYSGYLILTVVCLPAGQTGCISIEAAVVSLTDSKAYMQIYKF